MTGTNNEISLCEKGCYCMTHTVNGKCGKCGADKTTPDHTVKLKERIDQIVQQMLVDYTAWTKGQPVAWNEKKKEAKDKLIALLQEQPHKRYNSEEKELEICNCDGWWHVEGPDGISRYITDKSIDDLLKAYPSTQEQPRRGELEARYAEAKHWDYNVIPGVRGKQFQKMVDMRFKELEAELAALDSDTREEG